MTPMRVVSVLAMVQRAAALAHVLMMGMVRVMMEGSIHDSVSAHMVRTAAIAEFDLKVTRMP